MNSPSKQVYIWARPDLGLLFQSTQPLLLLETLNSYNSASTKQIISSEQEREKESKSRKLSYTEKQIKTNVQTFKLLF